MTASCITEEEHKQMATLLNAPVLIPKNAFQCQTYCPFLRWEQCEVEEWRFSRWFSIGRLIDNSKMGSA
ncbi:hypothetical protein T4D_3083 [Trichinella pseudospiralis]|uniref:Uncharacterized protein n=1 Tax=Trichinella pseudospiralis TaxID=6337 RepID=A0A0V1F2H3_TRIPS|nr:hypothetical protein T4D_3083 [Trichinella pseudospiralis]